ncbi:MAG: hypothetical protein NTY57_04380 [Solirubrobacterales bacterium]|nr:hypothetical protein [Solirubrobacterales bacterium]
MSSVNSSTRRYVAALAALSITLAAILGGFFAAGDQSASAAGSTTASFVTGYSSQKTIASKKKIQISVTKPGGLASPTTPVSISLTRGSVTAVITSVKAVSFGSSSQGKATVSLVPTTSGKQAIALCTAATLKVNVDDVVVQQEPIYIDSTSCITKAPAVDTATASRCDITDTADCLYPFPNDYFTVKDSTKATGQRLNYKLLSMPITVPTLFAGRKYFNPDELNKFDGFSPGSMMITHVPGLTSNAAIAATGMPTVNNIGKYSETNQAAVLIDAATGVRQAIWAEDGQGYSDATIDKVASTPADSANLIIHPAKNLQDGHRYIVALRNLKTASGAAIPASDGFRLFRDRLVTKSSVVESRRVQMEAIFKTLKTAGIDRSGLNLAWDFTVASTRSLSERALKIRDDAFAKLGDTSMGDNVIQGTSPVWHITSVTNTPSDADSIRTIDGTIEVPCYLTSTNCATGGKFNYGPDGLPTQITGSKQLAQFRCTIPQSSTDGSGPMYTTLYGHGLFGSINEVGSRNVRQFGNENRMVVCGSNWSGMASADDLGPEDDTVTAAGVLSDLSNMAKISDRLQQGYLNFMYLGRALSHTNGLTTDAAFAVTKDGNSASYNKNYITYYGNSQGGIAGGGLTALSPDITRSVLYVGAMNYSMLLPRSTDFDEYKPYFFPVYTKLSQRPLLLGLIQISWDRGEPNGYANHITSNPLPNTPVKHVLMEMSFGDHQVANVATLVEARTLGLKVRQPYLEANRDTYGAAAPWGLSTLGAMPLSDNALIVWDIGPMRYPVDPVPCRVRSEQTFCGTPSPPSDNEPNRLGGDPHDQNIRTMATLRQQIGDYIKPNGQLREACGILPCYGSAYTGAP